MYTGIQSTEVADRIADYVQNPKGDDSIGRCLYASGIGCSAATVKADFADTRSRYDPNSKLKIEAFALVLSASREEFDPEDPEQVHQLHQVSLEVYRRAFPGRQLMAGTQIDGQSGLAHTHGIVSNIAHEDAEMTHTVKGRKVTEQVVAGKPFSSRMSNVFRIRSVTNKVLADEEFMASIGYDNSRLGELMKGRAGLDGTKFNGLIGKHAYDNRELVRVTRGTNAWLQALKDRIKDAASRSTDEASFRQELSQDGAVELVERGNKKVWSYKYTDENGKSRTVRSGSKRLHLDEGGREAILQTLDTNGIDAAAQKKSAAALAFERHEAERVARWRKRAAERDAAIRAMHEAQSALIAQEAALHAAQQANRDAQRAEATSRQQTARRAVLDNPPARFQQLPEPELSQQVEELVVVKNERLVGLWSITRIADRDAMRKRHGLTFEESKYLDVLWEDLGRPETSSERPEELAATVHAPEPSEATVKPGPSAVPAQADASSRDFEEVLAEVKAAEVETDLSWLDRLHPKRKRPTPAAKPAEPEDREEAEAVVLPTDEPSQDVVDLHEVEVDAQLADEGPQAPEVEAAPIAEPIAAEPVAPTPADEPATPLRESNLRLIKRTNERKQRTLDAMADFEEQHAWTALACGEHLDEALVPSGVGRAWMTEFGEYLDPAVSEQLWLRVALIEEHDAEFRAGHEALSQRNELRAALGSRSESSKKFLRLDTSVRRSNLRRQWLKSKRAAGDYDLGDEDRSAYTKVVIAERAAQNDQAATSELQQPSM
ncbi:hypothetical protein AOZ07_11465 [Glutamicibacter halophytocola]|uniref:hypothetical protein n=1 Tax=Glutamicibacter halophytocola TaxID=1933880 RepID=UPI0006D4BBDB|nr:hypothetical protein [Glutamicibacter halophytocola]ALG29536.1 hypothetical protein AOZ07_11465 [Glutamicibacter halophytocola]